jgi:N-acetyltransferase
MVYNSNDKDEKKLHNNYHVESEKILKYENFVGSDNIVKEWDDGKIVVIEIGVYSENISNKIRNIINYVDEQLGMSGNSNRIAMSSKKISNDDYNYSKLYCFVSFPNNLIDGIALAESIDFAYQIKYMNNKETSYAYNEEIKEKVKCGISRIWVSNNMRHNKVATRLLDCVRSNFLYIQTVGLNQIAFSSPTENGIKLAASYTKTNFFLIYG